MTDPTRASGSPPATPRWVKVLAIGAVVVVLVVVVIMLVVGGGHGPWQHAG